MLGLRRSLSDNDPLLASEKQPAKTMQQLILAAAYLKNGMSKITMPILILHGTADNVTKPSGSESFYRQVSSQDKTLRLYDGHYHDLLNDSDREIVIEDILEWLKERS